MRESRGFTLVELSMVIMVLGLVVAIGLVNFIRMKDNSTRASCISNQRNLAHALKLYLVDHPTDAAALSVADLHAGDYVGANVSECPDSGDGSLDDYTLTVAGGEPAGIVCSIRPLRHQWTSP